MSSSSSSSPQQQQQLPANLALCTTTSQRTSESPVPSCLEWETATSSAMVLPNKNTNSIANNQQQLQWRFEEGLLRFVGDDGFATSLCLGPKTSTLFSNAITPYELVLQTCPGMEGTDLVNPKENIFSHSVHQVGFEEQQQQALSIQQQDEEDPLLVDRHMRFLIGGDGRIRSLATVLDSNNSSSSSNDLVAEQPFCITAASSSKNAYLVPCMDHQDETRVYSNAKEATEQQSPRSVPQIFKGDQQIFEQTSNSFYDSFLLDWKNVHAAQDTSTIQLAYQIGFQGPDASIASAVGPSLDDYDSFAVRVQAIDREEQEDETSQGGRVFDTILESGQTSGVRVYPTSAFGCEDTIGNGQQEQVTTLGAFLVGKSSNGSTPPELLASTSFLVHSSGDGDGTQDSLSSTPTLAPSGETSKFFVRLPWAHFFFWGFIIFFAILIKVHKICRPSSSTEKDSESKKNAVSRASHLTVDTGAASQGSLHLTPSTTNGTTLSPSSSSSPVSPQDFIIHDHQKRRRSSRGSFSTRDSSRRSQQSISMARCALQAQEQLRLSSSPPTSYHSRSFHHHQYHSSPTSTNLVPCSSHSRRALYEWDDERPPMMIAQQQQQQLDTTQTTVNTSDELSERNYMDEDAVLDIMLCNSDIEADSVDDDDYYDDDDDDIEARR